MVDLINDVFTPVYERVVEKKADLIGKQIKPTHGFECWLLVQLFFALENTKLEPECHSQGVDITFSDGSKLELKTDSGFSLPWIIKDGALKHKAPVLFLSGLKRKNKIRELEGRPEVKVLHYDYFNDGEDKWILGLIEPIQSHIDKHHERVMETVKKGKIIPKQHQIESKALKRSQKNYPPQLRKRGTYQDFEDLKDHLENAPDSKITMCMDKVLLEGRTYDQLLEEMAINNKRLGSNDFLNISRIDGHIKYREDHDGWRFKYSGERKESNTHVRLVGLRLVKST